MVDRHPNMAVSAPKATVDAPPQRPTERFLAAAAGLCWSASEPDLRVRACSKSGLSLEGLRETREMLEAHVRHEQRVLFRSSRSILTL